MHPWVKGIQVCSNEGPHPLPRGDKAQSILGWRGFKFSEMKGPALFKGEIVTNSDYSLTKLKNLRQNHWANFNQTWHDASLGEGDFTLFKWRTVSFPKGEIITIITKIHKQNLKILFSRTTDPISTNFGTKHPWVKGIQVCSNEGPHPLSRGDNSEIAEIHKRN